MAKIKLKRVYKWIKNWYAFMTLWDSVYVNLWHELNIMSISVNVKFDGLVLSTIWKLNWSLTIKNKTIIFWKKI